jgi:GNAT superfamily N-acetyltransferase
MKIRPFTPDDLLAFNAVNLDRYTETVRWKACGMECGWSGGSFFLFPFSLSTQPAFPTSFSLFLPSLTLSSPHTKQYNLGFYLNYLARWPGLCLAAVDDGGRVAGYVLGKVEGRGRDWHGHVTALAVAPAYRRRGLAASLMASLEGVSAQEHDAFYVDLFVRASNTAAIRMYEKVREKRLRKNKKKWMEKMMGE